MSASAVIEGLLRQGAFGVQVRHLPPPQCIVQVRLWGLAAPHADRATRCRDEPSSIMRAGLFRITMSDRLLDRSVMHMREPFILVLLCQCGEIAVDLVRLATGSSHLNRQMFNAEIGADFSADGVKQVIGQG